MTSHPSHVASARTSRSLYVWSVAVVLSLVLVASPPFLPGSIVNVGIMMLIVVTLAQGWNFLGGVGGQACFGHPVFFGLGAYTAAILYNDYGISPWLGLVVAVVLAGLIGWLLGYITFRARLHGIYFALVTLAVLEVFFFLAKELSITGNGASITIRPKGQGLAHLVFASNVPFWYVTLFVTLMILGFFYWLRSQVLQYQLTATRQNESAAEAVGINTVAVKTIGMVISAATAAIGGVLFVFFIRYIDPEVGFGVRVLLDFMLIPVLLGGIGTFWGPIIGSVVWIAVSEVSRWYIGTGIREVLIGLTLMAVVLVVPKGIYGVRDRWAVRRPVADKPGRGAHAS